MVTRLSRLRNANYKRVKVPSLYWVSSGARKSKKGPYIAPSFSSITVNVESFQYSILKILNSAKRSGFCQDLVDREDVDPLQQPLFGSTAGGRIYKPGHDIE